MNADEITIEAAHSYGLSAREWKVWYTPLHGEAGVRIIHCARGTKYTADLECLLENPDADGNGVSYTRLGIGTFSAMRKLAVDTLVSYRKG